METIINYTKMGLAFLTFWAVTIVVALTFISFFLFALVAIVLGAYELIFG